MKHGIIFLLSLVSSMTACAQVVYKPFLSASGGISIAQIGDSQNVNLLGSLGNVMSMMIKPIPPELGALLQV